ncbi:GtrA family protein [Qipengyuania sp. JC766]|uniref:GtrA family protein n=1 Tax=Qipengyuania sp. JC766 TaxID=3232139 RepID=UPI003458F5B7
MTRLFWRAADIRLVRYLMASVGALAVDVGLFLLLLQAGLLAALASAVGYCAGILAHWLLSSRTVFQDRVAITARDRTRQKALFVASALLGLAITTLIVGAADAASLDPRPAKLFAIGVSFTATWVLRSKVVFRARI